MAALREEGMEQLDFFVRNREGELLTTDSDHVTYLMKEWYDASESDGRKKEDVSQAAGNLARLHKSAFSAMKKGTIKNSDTNSSSMSIWEDATREVFEKRIREMKKVRNYITHKSQKTEFELYYLKHFDQFFDQARTLTAQMNYTEKLELTCCHGDYNYHNLLHKDGQVITLNFEHFIFDTCIRDLSNYCRKVSEKNNWDPEYGHIILNAYEKERSLTHAERRNLAYRLFYPEKFYKISSNYLNSKKTWIPVKNHEKLENLVENDDKKNAFLKEIFHL